MAETPLIRQKIHDIRGQRVMLDFDLAELYGVPTKALKQAVKRNLTRFQEDFMFELSRVELDNLRSQIVTPSWGGHRYLPYAFTEQGVAMLSSVLRSEKAIQVNIAIMRAFVEFRRYALTYAELAQRIDALEAKLVRDFADVHEVLRWLGEENQARANDIAALQAESARAGEAGKRPVIGFKRDTENAAHND